MQAWAVVVAAVLDDVAATLAAQGGIGPTAYVVPDLAVDRWFQVSVAVQPGPQRDRSLALVGETVGQGAAAVIWVADGWGTGPAGREPRLTAEVEMPGGERWRLTCGITEDETGTSVLVQDRWADTVEPAPPAPLIARAWV